MEILKAYIEDALTGNARVRGGPKRLPIYRHFNLAQALDQLEIWLEQNAAFEDGVAGWSREDRRSIAVEPTTTDPVNVAIHEIAHILLPARPGKVTERTKAVLEAEIELVAFLVKRSLGSRIYLSHGRSYIQSRVKLAKPLRLRLELVEKAALEILKAGHTEHRISPGTASLGVAVAHRNYRAAERSADFFWKAREREPDSRLPMPTGRRDPLADDYTEGCIECGDDDAYYIAECMDELCKPCMRIRLRWERDNGLIRKSEYRNLLRELSARFD